MKEMYKAGQPLEQKAIDFIQTLDITFDNFPFGKDKLLKEIEKMISKFLQDNSPVKAGIPTCIKCGQYIAYDPTTDKVQCPCQEYEYMSQEWINSRPPVQSNNEHESR